MKLLLDTHAFLWWIAGAGRLSPRAADAIADAGNEVFVSAASLWEIAIKLRLGRLSIAADEPDRFLLGQVRENSFHGLPVTARHAVRLCVLPDHHRDPFDRMLVAQALVEGMPIASGDREIARYGAEVVW